MSLACDIPVLVTVGQLVRAVVRTKHRRYCWYKIVFGYLWSICLSVCLSDSFCCFLFHLTNLHYNVHILGNAHRGILCSKRMILEDILDKV